MDGQQPVTGFFDNVAEAQQAVQILLINGFSPKALTLSGQAGWPVPKRLAITRHPRYTAGTQEQPPEDRDEGANPADSDSQAGVPSDRVTAASGRFFVSLFGRVQDGVSVNQPDIAHLKGTLVTVVVQSVVEADRATDLLNRAGGVTS